MKVQLLHKQISLIWTLNSSLRVIMLGSWNESISKTTLSIFWVQWLHSNTAIYTGYFIGDRTHSFTSTVCETKNNNWKKIVKSSPPLVISSILFVENEKFVPTVNKKSGSKDHMFRRERKTLVFYFNYLFRINTT